MKANYNNTPEATSQVSLGNLYEINQNLMNHEPVISDEAKEKGIKDIKNFFNRYFHQKYFMLLCKEQSDYTIFNLSNPCAAQTCATAAKDLVECIENRGQWLAVSEEKDDGGIPRALEIWIRINGLSYAYYFFPYGEAVLEY